MLSVSLLSLVLTAAPASSWQKDYAVAYKQAKDDKKDLFIYFRADDAYDDVFDDDDVKDRLKNFVCLRIPTDYVHKEETLLGHDAFEDMLGRRGRRGGELARSGSASLQGDRVGASVRGQPLRLGARLRRQRDVHDPGPAGACHADAAEHDLRHPRPSGAAAQRLRGLPPGLPRGMPRGTAAGRRACGTSTTPTSSPPPPT